MRRKILPIGLAVSLVLNALCFLALRDFDHRYSDLWVQRWKAEHRAKALQESLDFNYQLLEQASSSRPTPALDALARLSEARALEASANAARSGVDLNDRLWLQMESHAELQRINRTLQQQQYDLQNVQSEIVFRLRH